MRRVSKRGRSELMPKSPEYKKLKEQILKCERVLLHTIEFDLSVDHPYQYLVKLVREVKGPSQGQRELAQIAWNFVNDSMRTSCCLRFTPLQVARSALYLGATYLRLDGKQLPGKGSRSWETVLNISAQHLNEICSTIMELYEPSLGLGQSDDHIVDMRSQLVSLGRIPAASNNSPATSESESDRHRDKRARHSPPPHKP